MGVVGSLNDSDMKETAGMVERMEDMVVHVERMEDIRLL